MALAVIEHSEYPFAKGDLTSGGIQWSAEVDTTTAGVDVEVESVTIKPRRWEPYLRSSSA